MIQDNNDPMGTASFLEEKDANRRQLLWSFGRGARSMAAFNHLIVHHSAEAAVYRFTEIISPLWGVWGVPPRPDLETAKALERYEDNDDLIEDFETWCKLPNKYAQRHFISTGGVGIAFTPLIPSTIDRKTLSSMKELWDHTPRDDYYQNIERCALWLEWLPACVLALQPEGSFFFLVCRERAPIEDLRGEFSRQFVFSLEVEGTEVHWPGAIEV